ALEGLSFEKVESGELGKAESELPGGSADVSLLEDSPTAEAFDPEADAAGRGFEDSPIAEVADEFSPAGETPEQEVASEPGCAALPVEGVDLEQLDAGVEVESQQAPGALEAGEAERDSTFSSFETGEPSAEPGDESGSMSSGIAVPPDADALGQESIPTPAGFGADEPSAARSAELALDGEQPLAGLLPEESAEGEAGGASLVPPEPAELEGWDSMPSASDAEEGESGPAIEDPSGSEAVPTAEDFANLENRASEPDRPVGLEDEAAGCELSPVSDSGNEVDPWSAGGATDALSQQTETDSSPADLAGAAVAVVDLDATTLDSQAAAAASFELAAEPSEPDETAPSAAGESSFETNAQEFAPACDPSDPSVQDALGPLDWGASPSDLGAEGASTSFEDSPVNDALPVEPSSAPQAALDDEIEIPLADGVSEPAASGSAAPPPEVAPAAPAVPSDFELAVLAGLRCIAEGRVGEGRPIPVDRLGRVAVKLLLEKGAITSDDLIEMLAVSPETLSTLIVKLLLNQKLIGPEDLVSMLAIPPDRLNATVLLLLIEKGVFDCSSVVKALG
ncbi:MAG TPA: hypothetical protein DFS52_12605, partial [Myxococcales bacterium]|nr:hypothetical protein [Myxococcales bacterium]